MGSVKRLLMPLASPIRPVHEAESRLEQERNLPLDVGMRRQFDERLVGVIETDLACSEHRATVGDRARGQFERSGLLGLGHKGICGRGGLPAVVIPLARRYLGKLVNHDSLDALAGV